jgi:hypothetical protein
MISINSDQDVSSSCGSYSQHARNSRHSLTRHYYWDSCWWSRSSASGVRVDNDLSLEEKRSKKTRQNAEYRSNIAIGK